ncbi:MULTISPECIES: hypothetical protein [unclassified Mucilaginibacter]|uniref:hypothetical protein n=1 Tax=unclassified Mucilaginibacter TaxID=2617802 RepID=UPI000968D530|nr:MULTISPECIES: hypothetical protein [unclassified Mucilaginibacter]OJW13533.1 MAG: hypothetical protein BGO48_01910 [Mucilaginibacter sp. 44-25]PLW89780.1 MAG: hypothetical protein C0154_09825 [Mucilaginibacter sp.]HEK20987.1 hypothetical protein [Bacteroidota bacterium]
MGVTVQTLKPIQGVLGIKFGSDLATVTEAVKTKGGVINRAGSKPDRLFVENISLGTKKSEYVIFLFIDNKMYGAAFVFKPELKPQLVDSYNALVKDISSVYGEGRSVKDFKPPYEEGDGYEVQAITTGNASFLTYWINDDKSQINIMPQPDGTILLGYKDGKLGKLATEKDQEKEKADF